MKSIEKFSETQSIDSILKRKASDILSESEYMQSRKKVFDDTDKEAGIVALARVSPWLPQSTPSHTESSIKEPPKRPLSPFSGQPLRAKDLIPIDLVRESTDEEVASMSGPVRYICPVARLFNYYHLLTHLCNDAIVYDGVERLSRIRKLSC